MLLRLSESKSPIAPWSMRLALLSLQLLIVGVALHRFASLSSTIAINLLVVAIAGAAIAALVALWALGRIWTRGESGATSAVVGLLVGLGVFGWPAAFLPQFLARPMLTDVTTDVSSPPGFSALASARAMDGRPTGYPGEAFAAAQQKAYPDIQPIITPKSSFDAFVVAREVAKSLGWEIVREQQPGKEGGTGIIEATDQTLIMGFTDDISIRVTGDDKISRVDLRSASRIGIHDLGRNADRLRTALKQMYLALDATVTTDQAEDEVASKDGGASSKKKRKKSSSGSENRRKKQVASQSSTRYEQARKAQQQKQHVRRRKGIQSSKELR